MVPNKGRETRGKRRVRRGKVGAKEGAAAAAAAENSKAMKNHKK